VVRTKEKTMGNLSRALPLVLALILASTVSSAFAMQDESEDAVAAGDTFAADVTIDPNAAVGGVEEPEGEITLHAAQYYGYPYFPYSYPYYYGYPYYTGSYYPYYYGGYYPDPYGYYYTWPYLPHRYYPYPYARYWYPYSWWYPYYW
jgi:hypothetical protein